MLRARAQSLREPAGRVVVRPALAVDDLDRVERLQYVGNARVVGCRSGDLRPGVERLGRRTWRPHGLLRDADDAEVLGVAHEVPSTVHGSALMPWKNADRNRVGGAVAARFGARV